MKKVKVIPLVIPSFLSVGHGFKKIVRDIHDLPKLHREKGQQEVGRGLLTRVDFYLRDVTTGLS